MKIEKSRLPKEWRMNLNTRDWEMLAKQGFEKNAVVFGDVFNRVIPKEAERFEYFVHEGRMTLYAVANLHTDIAAHNLASYWLVEAPSRINGASYKQTAHILADLCVLRYNIKEKE